MALHDKVHSLIADGVNQVVIDLNKVTWMNSSGLGAPLASLISIRNVEGKLTLAHVIERIGSLPSSIKPICVFDTYDSVERAVASFLK